MEDGRGRSIPPPPPAGRLPRVDRPAVGLLLGCWGAGRRVRRGRRPSRTPLRGREVREASRRGRFPMARIVPLLVFFPLRTPVLTSGAERSFRPSRTLPLRPEPPSQGRENPARILGLCRPLLPLWLSWGPLLGGPLREDPGGGIRWVLPPSPGLIPTPSPGGLRCRVRSGWFWIPLP